MKHDANEIFNRYTVNNTLLTADIFHLYDTGKECMEDNSGYHDSRHFNLWIFNTETMEKRDLGRHDGIMSYPDNCKFILSRVYSDGSFLIRFEKPVTVDNTQCVFIREKI